MKTTQAEEPRPEPCKTCGTCPTCGHAPVVVKPVYPVPYWVQPWEPYVQPYTITYGSNTASTYVVKS